MADYTDNTLLAAIKALEHVVLPAVDPSDPLAIEQLRLVTGVLKFLRGRLPSWQQRHRFELAHYLDMGRQLASEARKVSDDVAQRLDAAIERAAAVHREEAPAVPDMRAATAALASPISGLARLVANANPELRRRVEHTILAGSKRWVDMQRAWFLPHGFELRAEELPDLGGALRETPALHRATT